VGIDFFNGNGNGGRFFKKGGLAQPKDNYKGSEGKMTQRLGKILNRDESKLTVAGELESFGRFLL
jgi:hypothetical protein